MATTYIQCYGTRDDSVPRSEVIKKAWGVNDNNSWVKLGGYWKDSGWNATSENYFVVEEINGSAVSDSQVTPRLEQIARSTMRSKYGESYAHNVTFFASNSSAGYEYPALSPSQAAAIQSGQGVFNYTKLLRYAFASDYVYGIEPGAAPSTFSQKRIFKDLMQAPDSSGLDVIDTFTGSSGLIAMAIKVPGTKELDEEIIISYKGTSNQGDIIQDVELMMGNLVESDVDWQKDAHDFYQRITKRYPPNSASLASGYQSTGVTQGHNVVLTGHSLGAYTAAGVGVRTGVLTRVFSSPATRLISKYTDAFANTMRLNNVVNFIRRFDPVATVSGNHDENMVYFPSTGGMNVIENHLLTGMIGDLLLPLSENSKQNELLPEFVYVTPDASTGASLNSRINYWGEFNP
ncbi:MAG: hypothetical protein GKR96_03645 [Gammaproteobacteria bacterium]|nr:hypothetical protein [Gammaproteobacteria bacterium]